MDKEAVAELQKAVRLSGGSAICIADRARAYVASGKMNKAVKLLSDLKKSSNASFTNAPQIAMIYASMGDNDQAMHWLERATKNDLIRAFYCALDSILSARTRALKTLCGVLAWLVEPEYLMTRNERNEGDASRDQTTFHYISNGPSVIRLNLND